MRASMTGNRKRAWKLSILMLLALPWGFQSCKNPGIRKPRIVYINSYHQGFPPSDQITRGVMKGLTADSFEVVSYFMDTKRNPAEAYIKARAEELLDSIREMKPDLLIVSDDNAMKYLVVPHFQNDPLPIVFCGVNWTVDQYDISDCNITGVLEILPVERLIQTVKPYYPEMKKLLVLNENTTTSRKTKPLLDTLIAKMGLQVYQELVDDFESWKSVFREANEVYDIIYLQTRGAITGWDHDESLKHMDEFLRVPVVTCEEFMMPYAVFGLTQYSEEQGMIAAEKAKAILEGTSPSDIPISRNQMSKAWINARWAGKIAFEPDQALLEQAADHAILQTR
jgi:ABC-type uncharacterized transport system substrate-binding protein